MSDHVNALDQAIGFPLPDWHACEPPSKACLEGEYCRLERLNPDKHAMDLFDAFGKDSSHRNWTYLPYGPFTTFEAFSQWLNQSAKGQDPLFYAVVNQQSGRAVGLASYLRITPDAGCIEVGHIHFSPLMQKTPVSTEAMYLMMKYVFDELGYRRYEWKCDNLNSPSKNAAQRLGFSFEGVFRQATVYKQRNRDTAWLSILDNEWPLARAGFEAWLSPENFDEVGQQIHSLRTKGTATDANTEN